MAEIGLAMRVDRRRHANQQGVGQGKSFDVSRDQKTTALVHRLDSRVGYVPDVGAAGEQSVDFLLIDIEADDLEACRDQRFR